MASHVATRAAYAAERPADDDALWCFRSHGREVQIERASGELGECLFFIEERGDLETRDAVVSAILELFAAQ